MIGYVLRSGVGVGAYKMTWKTHRETERQRTQNFITQGLRC